MNEKRKRGRPTGTGKDDRVYLRQVASLLLDDPSLKPTTAMHRTIRNSQRPESDDTLVRRLQSKWKEHGVAYLNEAKQQRAQIEKYRAVGVPQYYTLDSVSTSYLGSVLPEIGATMRNIASIPGIGETMKAIRAFDNPMSSAQLLTSIRSAVEVGKVLKEHQSILRLIRDQNAVRKAIEGHQRIYRLQDQIKNATTVIKAHRGF